MSGNHENLLRSKNTMRTCRLRRSILLTLWKYLHSRIYCFHYFLFSPFVLFLVQETDVSPSLNFQVFENGELPSFVIFRLKRTSWLDGARAHDH